MKEEDCGRRSRDQIFQNPQHPYTQKLLRAIPKLRNCSRSHQTYLLECKDITHHYNDPAIAGWCFDVSFTLNKGHRLGLVGESGSGKSVPLPKFWSELLDVQEGKDSGSGSRCWIRNI